ncbi:class D sortase [Neobacillus mesonae]|uniref:Class D sortase n=1 Tax=Neobacillus mesonae TaxID=1193713 RepID=A0A3T0I2H1_9BACI|nr:class D sortase [Neobacillus mesonae]AZU63541.1 class D sortase [Neobacillus mesonae]
MKAKLPLILILTGLIIIGFAAWQLLKVKMQTDASIKQAKEIVANNKSVEPAEAKKQLSSLETGDTAGLLVIPKINAELAIIEGTDPDDLEKGVGHYKGSYFPDEAGQIILSGHRDTVFRHLGELKLGDSLEVQMPYGNFTYEIINTKIVNADDTSIITLQRDHEELILTTCYPFRFVGNAPERYIIYATRK